MKREKHADYSVPNDVCRIVKDHFASYYIYYNRAHPANFEEADYYPIGSSCPSPDSVYSITNEVSRPTESYVLRNLDREIAMKDAETKIKCIETGIMRAARTTKSPAYVKDIYDKLKDNLVDGVPNESSKIFPTNGTIKTKDKKAFKLYKDKAIYFTAVEFGLIEPSKEVLAEEVKYPWQLHLKK